MWAWLAQGLAEQGVPPIARLYLLPLACFWRSALSTARWSPSPLSSLLFVAIACTGAPVSTRCAPAGGYLLGLECQREREREEGAL
jgi:hypothetical protein